MKFGGELISSLEYPGKMALVIFTGKCVFRCPYCHNPELVYDGEEVEVDEVILKIKNSIEYIDSVVISGGEPLYQYEDVEKILKYSKSRGLSTKLETNGYSPKNLKKILKWLDYVALDIKAPFDKYDIISGRNCGNEVKNSMEISREYSDTYLECRTTYVPSLLNHNDIKEIARNIQCDRYTIQQFRNKRVLNEKLKNIPNPSRDELRRIAELIKPYLDNIYIETAEFGEEKVKRDGITYSHRKIKIRNKV